MATSRLIDPTPFRFSVRDLLWLTALVAVLVAWWVDRRELIRPPAYTVKAAKDDFIITDTKTGQWLLRIEKSESRNWTAWRREGQSWLNP